MCAVDVGIHGNSTFLYERIDRDRRIISQDTISALTTFHLLHLILANTKAALVLNTLINQTLRSKPSSNIWKSTLTIEIKQTIVFPADSNGEASPAEKSTSKPSNAGTCARLHVYGAEDVHLPLLQRFEELCVILLKLSEQCMKTVSLLHSSQHNREKRILSNNASTLLHQLDITLSIAAVYKSQHPGFDNILTLLTATDRATLIANLHGYCSKFWNALSAPLTEHLRHIIIRFITGLNGFLVTYLGSSFRLSSSSFRTPRTTANPSIIH